MTLDEQIEKVEKEAKRMKFKSSWLWLSMFCESIIQIVKEQQKEIEKLKKKVNKPRQGQPVSRSKDNEA